MFTSILIVIALVDCKQHQVNADIITLADFSGNESIIDFGDPASSSVKNSPYTIGSVTFTTNTTNQFFVQEPSGGFSSNFTNISGASLQGSLRDAADIADFEISFTTPVNRAGFLITGCNDIATFVVTAFDGTTVLQTQTVSQPSTRTAVFAGFEFAQDITSLRILETSVGTTNVTGIDDVRFESTAVPEPSSLALFSVVTPVYLLYRRRSKRRITM